MKYRKKPVVIDAIKVRHALGFASSNLAYMPDWLKSAYEDGKVIFGDQFVSIATLEGQMRGNLEDYIIRGVSGELYPCKPDIFEKTYEPA